MVCNSKAAGGKVVSFYYKREMRALFLAKCSLYQAITQKVISEQPQIHPSSTVTPFTALTLFAVEECDEMTTVMETMGETMKEQRDDHDDDDDMRIWEYGGCGTLLPEMRRIRK